MPRYQVPSGGYTLPPGVTQPPYVRPVPLGPGGAPLAEVWERLLAYLLDSLVLLVPTLIAELIAFTPFALVLVSSHGEPSPTPVIISAIGGSVLLFALILAVNFGYEVVYMHRSGQTVGRRVLKIKIVKASDGTPIDRRIATRRWLVKHLAPLFAWFGFSYANVLWQLWDQPYRQCLHDKCADTVVVKVAA
jgi:uncharacterized RDD family membrane protein YckC